MKTAKCPTCGKEFTRDTAAQAAMSLEIHRRTHAAGFGRVRDGGGIPPAAPIPPIPPLNPITPAGQFTATCDVCGKTFTGKTQMIANMAVNGHRNRSHNLNKSTMRKRQSATQVSVNYCPNCGCNLLAVATGLALHA